jgi:hypothetical protein
MNPSLVKLFLTLLWLVAGVCFLFHGLLTGRAIVLPLGRWQVPLSIPCLLIAALNFIRWWWTRSPSPAGPGLRGRRPRRDAAAEPDPTFRFDDPPPGPTGPGA